MCGAYFVICAMSLANLQSLLSPLYLEIRAHIPMQRTVLCWHICLAAYIVVIGLVTNARNINHICAVHRQHFIFTFLFSSRLTIIAEG